MTNSEFNGWAIGSFFLMLIAFIGGLFAGDVGGGVRVQQQAIEHNAAHYDPRTGAFTWNEEASER